MWQKNVHYLDFNAGAGLSVSVQQEIISLIQSELFLANPSSIHGLGQKVKNRILQAQEAVARSLGSGVTPAHLRFTGSGTQANRTVILEAAEWAQVFMIGAGEHSATWDMIPPLGSLEKEVQVVPLQGSGQLNFSALQEILSTLSPQKKAVLSLCWINNETGVVLDLHSLQSVLKPYPQVYLHLDGAQAWGKLSLDLFQTGAHWITFAGHKIGAPSGTGIIFTKESSGKKRKDGTENILGMVGLGAATASLNEVYFSQHCRELQRILETGLEALGKEIRIIGKNATRVSNTTRFTVGGFTNYENWVELLDLQGFAVSHGSACQSNIREPSRVLLAMGCSPSEALNTVRVSISTQTTLSDIEKFLKAFEQILNQKRKSQHGNKPIATC